jgi:hypothetical protein
MSTIEYPQRYANCKLNVIYHSTGRLYKWWLLKKGNKTPSIVYENLDQVYDDIIFRFRTGQLPNCTVYVHKENGLVDNVIANVSIWAGWRVKET